MKSNSIDISPEEIRFLAFKLRTLRTSARIAGLQNFSNLSVSDSEKSKFIKTIDEAKKAGLNIVHIFEDHYPQQLLQIYDPPPVLFYRGNLNILDNKLSIAIVGSRRGDSDGINLGLEFGEDLARRGFLVISGLALGIDSAAHRGALNSGKPGATVAILGNGLPEISPPSNKGLAEQILSAGGLVISQFDPHESPFPQNFLDRNRIISGLARAVLVIQATERSGSLVTARYALEQGREVFVIPGNIKNPRYKGSNQILRDGAGIVIEVGDLLEHFGISKTFKDGDPDAAAGAILSILDNEGEISIDDLRVRMGSPDDFYKQLIELEILGRLSFKPGNMVAGT